MKKSVKSILILFMSLNMLTACVVTSDDLSDLGSAIESEMESKSASASDNSASQESDDSSESLGQKNAVASAESYLAVMAFSRQSLIQQLEFEGFSKSDAEYAVDKINPDWNEQAAKSAQSYLDSQSFSRQGLIDQLVFEGFTQSQAEYGVSAVGY